VCLPCIREIAVILADVRHDQRLDEVEKRAGGEIQGCPARMADSRFPVRAGVPAAVKRSLCFFREAGSLDGGLPLTSLVPRREAAMNCGPVIRCAVNAVK
jgi:hypothetical protein